MPTEKKEGPHVAALALPRGGGRAYLDGDALALALGEALAPAPGAGEVTAGLLVGDGATPRVPNQFPRRKAKKEQNQHEQGEPCGRHAGACSRAHVTARLHHLGACRAPVAPDRVPTCAQEHGEHKNDEQQKKQSSQTRTSFEFTTTPASASSRAWAARFGNA